MRNDLTDITVVMDRSGSMMACCSDAQGGINSLIFDQKKQDGDATFTLLQFDRYSEYVHQAVPIAEVGSVTLSPRGSTALLDAVGKAVTDTGIRLAEMNEADRPALVVFVIVTDGQENSSSLFTRDQIKELIEHQQSVYQWKFIFLGANVDAFAEAATMGISMDTVANYNVNHIGETYRMTSNNITRSRSMTASGIGGQSVTMCFTPEEMKSMVGEKN